MDKDQLDFPGFAQEFLRRNPSYRKQFRDLNQLVDPDAVTVAEEDMARNWGLSFPVSAGCVGKRIPGLLVCSRVRLHRHS